MHALDHVEADAAYRDLAEGAVPHVVEHQHHAAGGEAAQMVVALEQDRRGAVARGRQRGGHAGRATAHHQDVGLGHHRDIARGFAYVAFVIDAFSRRILSWRVTASPRAELARDALEMAV